MIDTPHAPAAAELRFGLHDFNLASPVSAWDFRAGIVVEGEQAMAEAFLGDTILGPVEWFGANADETAIVIRMWTKILPDGREYRVEVDVG